MSHGAQVEKLLQQFLTSKPRPSNASLKGLENAWGLSQYQNLPLSSPTKLTPFEHHSKFNANPSYVRYPRLSVTKLLTDSWCELREYYKVYSGSIEDKKSTAIRKGNEYHSILESQSHEMINTGYLDDQVVEMAQTIDLSNVSGRDAESDMASEWSESIVSRLFSLLTTGEAREVLVHFYADLKEGTIVDGGPGATLVSGIVDKLTLGKDDPSDLTMFEDIRDTLDYTFQTRIHGEQVIDLQKALAIIESLRDPSHKITLSDIKTRSRRIVPPQESVVNAAKMQTFYYRAMLEVLSKNAYHSLLNNARSRGLDVDAPINVGTLAKILRQNYRLFFTDFVKLANGEPIGAPAFDDHARGHKYPEYDLSVMKNDKVSAGKSTGLDLLEVREILSDDLLTAWVTPPTLRYFAARADQLFSSVGFFLGPSTTVEYHTTSGLFHENKYTFDSDLVRAHLKHACEFWSGKRSPTYTSDTTRCKYCNFREKCVVAKGLMDPELPNKKAVGYRLDAFLRSCS